MNRDSERSSTCREGGGGVGMKRVVWDNSVRSALDNTTSPNVCTATLVSEHCRRSPVEAKRVCKARVSGCTTLASGGGGVGFRDGAARGCELWEGAQGVF